MHWLTILAIDAVAIYFIVKFSWFRNTLLVIMIVAGVFFYYNDLQQRKENEAASIRIFPEEIELIDLEFSDPFTQLSNEITGRVKNNSDCYELDTLYLKVQLVDIYDHRSEIIGDDEVSIQVDLPPQQARDFTVQPNFGALKTPKGKLDWFCSISLIKGVEPEYHTSNELNARNS